MVPGSICKLLLIFLMAHVIYISATLAESGGLIDSDIEPFLGEPVFGMQQIFNGQRFPNVVVTTEGTVLATWGQNNFVVRRSEDGGQSWGPEIEIGSGIHAGGVTVDEVTGDILVFVEDGHPPAPFDMYRSSDDGRTWQRDDNVTIHADVNGHVPNLHMSEAGITLMRGSYSGRLIRPARTYLPRPSNYNTAVYSDDGGQTWYTSDPFPETETGEGSIVELSDGVLLYDSRINSSNRPNPTKRRFAWSYDGGQSWQDWQLMEVLPDGPQDIRYGLMGGLTRLPVEDRDILLFSNVDSPTSEAYTYRGQEYTGSHTGRRRGTVWASFDGGQSWPVRRLAYQGPFAYSSLAAGRPGTPSEGWIYLQFEGGRNGHHGDCQIARFNLSWLLEGELTGDGELPDWIVSLAGDVGFRHGDLNADGVVDMLDFSILAENWLIYEK